MWRALAPWTAGLERRSPGRRVRGTPRRAELELGAPVHGKVAGGCGCAGVSRPDRSLDLLQFLKIWFARVILVERVTAADQTVARGSCAVAEGTADELFLERAFLDSV